MGFADKDFRNSLYMRLKTLERHMAAGRLGPDLRWLRGPARDAPPEETIPMKFQETPLHGAYSIELEKRGDDRGFFARFFCENEFARRGSKPASFRSTTR